MLLWLATHKETKTKKAEASRPKLQAILDKPGEWEVTYADLGKIDKQKVCRLYMRTKFIEKSMEKMVLVVEENGEGGFKVSKKRGQ